MATLRFLFFLILISSSSLSAQCTKPLSETCEEAGVFCSLNELNGAFCTTSSKVPSSCYPICNEGGKPDGTSWWAFVSQGGQATFTLHVGLCQDYNEGMQWGISGDCNCKEKLFCQWTCTGSNSTSVADVNLKPCKTYYLWFDGCNGDYCDITINTSGGAAPTLAPLGPINNKSNLIIDGICTGACGVPFFVDAQPGGCVPTYVWTLDGGAIDVNDNKIKLDFPDQGDFILCVTAFLGNPKSGSICTKQGPKCATVQVRTLPPKIGVRRTICWEAANPGGYKWHTKLIYNSGNYTETFREPISCCYYDSSVEFIVLPVPTSPDVYYITCSNQPYIDILGRSYNACKDHYHISLPKTSEPFHCDSSISLTAVNINIDSRWKAQCQGGQIQISPNIVSIKPCNAGESYEYMYQWYNKNDPTKKIISTDDAILVDPVSIDYCVDVSLKVALGNETLICKHTFCEQFNESDLIPSGVPINGEKTICINGTTTYKLDTVFSTKIFQYNWSIDGGMILSKKDSAAVLVKWNLPVGDTGKICLSITTDCGATVQNCIKVTFGKESAGSDYKQKGLITKLNSPSNANGLWKLISGPGTAVFENPTNPKTKVRVDKYGLYCFEWFVNDTNCISRDTVCILFYKPYIIPTNFFDERSRSFSQNDSDDEVLTPNLISKSGYSYINFDSEYNTEIHYTWYDAIGKIILNEKFLAQAGLHKFNIQSPVKDGLYFIAIEMHGARIVKKICVAD